MVVCACIRVRPWLCLTDWCVVVVIPQVVTEDVSPLPLVSMEMAEVLTSIGLPFSSPEEENSKVMCAWYTHFPVLQTIDKPLYTIHIVHQLLRHSCHLRI